MWDDDREPSFDRIGFVLEKLFYVCLIVFLVWVLNGCESSSFPDDCAYDISACGDVRDRRSICNGKKDWCEVTRVGTLA